MRIVIVTGGRGGIGAEIVAAFEALGDHVEVFDRVDGLDITDRAACERAVAEVIARHGRVDVLCNNAGVGAAGTVTDATPDDWERVLGVNVVGAANMAAAVLPSMRAARSGVIINTCSIAATVGLVDRVAYSASKGALAAMTRAMAADEAAHGIRVNSVSPATVDGPWVRRNAAAAPDPEAFLAAMRRRQPSNDLIHPQAVARAITWLADPLGGLTGVDLPVDGGMTAMQLHP